MYTWYQHIYSQVLVVCCFFLGEGRGGGEDVRPGVFIYFDLCYRSIEGLSCVFLKAAKKTNTSQKYP